MRQAQSRPIPTEQVEHVIAMSGYLEQGPNLLAQTQSADLDRRVEQAAQCIATGSLPEIDGIYWIDTIFG